MLCLVLVDGVLKSVHMTDLDAQMACFDAVKKNDAKSAQAHRVSSVLSFRWTAGQQADLDKQAREQHPESQR